MKDTWTIEELEKWVVSESVYVDWREKTRPNKHWKKIYSLLHTNGGAYKDFKAALIKAGCEFCPRRYEYCHHPHMLGQCITWEDAKRISADGP